MDNHLVLSEALGDNSKKIKFFIYHHSRGLNMLQQS